MNINPHALEIFICASPCSLPIPFVLHAFFVINDHGKITRFKVLHHKNSATDTYFHNSTYKGFEGMKIFPFSNSPKYKSKILYHISSTEDNLSSERLSLLKILKETLEQSEYVYPHRHKYFLTGKNSNTYAKWIIKESGVDCKLPWNCFGKDLDHSDAGAR